MRIFPTRIAAIAPVVALSIGNAAAAGGGADVPRALTLNVVEGDDIVELELVGDTAADLRVSYEIELIGNSRSRHRGDTQLAGGQRHVLSRLRTSYSENWCARVDVTEGNGAQYTITAGDCPAD